MRTTLTGLGTALIGLGLLAGPAPAVADATSTATPEVTRERGIVLDCAGTLDGRPVYASVYENDVFGNTVQVMVGEDDDAVGNIRTTDRAFLVKGKVRAGLRLDGDRAVVTGTAKQVGPRTRVHDEFSDAGYDLTITGTHRRLRHALALEWRGQATRLTCGDAFAYRLKVSKVPVDDGSGV